ncbi:MraY family glycosyltransferase [Flavobacterium cerinum]|uniref:UDP-GlcNAc--UDP-phosphate GlcNAc-1-phosphate transferase n=1 Tax=Flavobacterium cerinum TaxID=2502784 RepID=A0A444HE17_9FLAO|nr:UDP-GlcNAc--UDP-phosphate GlcNAc-1-phosphate transferase [Flavobacterium cerinum]RWX02407.1 UDP-GlcNAc--UDP-phosphate GlcNAc-1-phosphate transferase [Flavobacterium cerinum]
MHYLIIVVLLFALELLYFKIADRYNIIDKPNHRSSHTSITLRGGGVIFPVAMLIACVMGEASIAFTVAVVLVGVVSFIDDINPLHQLPRVISHLIAIALVLFDLDLLQGTALFWLPVLVVLAIGWINAFNFMDGINGITVLYALVTIASFAWMYQNESSLNVLITMGLACIVFGFFNIRKRAKTFAGDVGSVSMALFLAYFMIKLIAETGQIGYLLFFGVYGVDAVITILYRLKNKENIFQPHRSHLYQYLANEMKWTHVLVSLAYAVLQLIINGCVILLNDKGLLSIWVFIVLLIILAVLYMAIRISVKKKIAVESMSN